VIRTKGHRHDRGRTVRRRADQGRFFHTSRAGRAGAGAQHWNETTGGLNAAPYQQVADPRARLLAYIDFRAQLLQGELPDFTCLLGTMVQETYVTHPAIRQACDEGIQGHADAVALIAAQAKARYAPDADWTPESLALYTQAALQGAFILAKAKGGPEVAALCVAHLKRYVECLLGTTPAKPVSKRRAH
jgi:TetR/AcrR family transcriptional repressor of nem operon